VAAAGHDRDVRDLVVLVPVPVPDREPEEVVVERQCTVEVGDPDRDVVDVDDVL